MDNAQAADMFFELADLLDLAGELPFKAAAYRKVALSLQRLGVPLGEIVATGKYDKIPGAGRAIREKLANIVATGKLPALDKWREHKMADFYPWLDLMKIRPRPLGLLAGKLGATEMKELIIKLRDYNLKALTGQVKETAEKIIENENRLAKRLPEG